MEEKKEEGVRYGPETGYRLCGRLVVRGVVCVLGRRLADRGGGRKKVAGSCNDRDGAQKQVPEVAGGASLATGPRTSPSTLFSPPLPPVRARPLRSYPRSWPPVRKPPRWPGTGAAGRPPPRARMQFCWADVKLMRSGLEGGSEPTVGVRLCTFSLALIAAAIEV